MSRSMFDDIDTVAQSGLMEAADSRTLRLSAHPLTESELEGLVRYQEAFLGHMEQAAVAHDAFPTAHELGLKASGLDLKVLEMANALVRAYCGQRWTAWKVRTRLTELEKQTDAASKEKARKARDELGRLEDLQPLARRYGQQAIDLLEQHEERLVALHTRMQKALTRA